MYGKILTMYTDVSEIEIAIKTTTMTSRRRQTHVSMLSQETAVHNNIQATSHVFVTSR